MTIEQKVQEEENEGGSSNIEYSVQQEPQEEATVLEDVLVEYTDNEMMDHHATST